MVFVTQTIIGAEGGPLLQPIPENVEAALELRTRQRLENASTSVKGHLKVILVSAQGGERRAEGKPLSPYDI